MNKTTNCKFVIPTLNDVHKGTTRLRYKPLYENYVEFFFFYHEGGSRIYQSPSGESDGVFRVSGNFFLIELDISIAVMPKILSRVKNQMPLHRIISFTRRESLDNRWTFAMFVPQ